MLYQFFICLFIFSSQIFSAYLKNVPQSITQPDGSIINCFSSGDEFYNWVHDEEGYTIVMNQEDGYCYYASSNMLPSEYRVNSINPNLLNLSKWIKITDNEYALKKKKYFDDVETRDCPTTGTVNNINVFIRFADEEEFGGTASYYDEPFSKEEGPSMRHYFNEVSYNSLDVITNHFPLANDEIVVSYQDQYPRNYYQPYNAQNNPEGYTNNSTQREHTLLRNAIEFIESQVPEALIIDGDGDNRVDNVTFLVYGSPGAWADLLWPHRWSLYSYNVFIHGKRVYDYNLNLATGGYFTVGTLCHEFNHSLGAPDLYHYNETGAPVAVGGWDVMDSSGDPPQYMGAFMKAKYGNWINDTNGDGENNEYDIPLLVAPGLYELNPLHEPTNYAYRIKSPYTENQYFVVEYRYKQGLYETNTPGNDNGLLVYRINTCCGGNAQGPPDEVYVYRPNGDADTNGNLGWAIFNNEIGRDKINDQTNPSAFLYPGSLGNGNYCDDPNGCEGGLYIKDIGNPGETIQFKYMNVFLNAKYSGISNDSDGDGLLNQGEEATLFFMLENTSVDGFAYAVSANLYSNDYFDVLSEPQFIEELPAQGGSTIISFNIKVKDEAEVGNFLMNLSINATVYQEEFGDFDYDDITEYSFSVSLNQKGFPYETQDQVFCSPAIFDIDQNGDKEIIFGDNSGMFYILNQEDMSTYAIHDLGDEIWGAPAIDDFDNDGNYDIAITCKNNMFYILNHLGEIVYSHDTESYLLASPAVGEGYINNNSQNKEIWVPTFDSNGKILIYHNINGNWDVFEHSVNKKILKGIALFDPNNDGITDWAYGTDDNTLEVSILDQIDVYDVGGKVRSAPAIIKFNENEYLIIVPSKDDNMYGINPLTGNVQFIYETNGDVESPSFFEHLELGTVIVFGSSDGLLHMIDTNGNSVNEWPKNINGAIIGSPVISDIDNDGFTDIIVGQAEGKLYGFNENGDMLNNFPLSIEFPFTSTPTIEDLDGDGDLEVLIGGSDGLYGYDIKYPSNSDNYYWSMYRGSLLRTGMYTSENQLDAEFNFKPNVFNISSIYPNPFNPKTSINIDVPNNDFFNLSVYNLKGELVTQIYEGRREIGAHSFVWDASNFSTGMYIVKIDYKNTYITQKIMLIK